LPNVISIAALSDLPFATAEQLASANTQVLVIAGVDNPSTAFAKNTIDAKTTLPTLFAAIGAAVAEEDDLVVIGAQTITDNSGDADHTTTQAAVTAIQEALDAVIVLVNLIKNQHQ
jgi:NAD(P)-dependent dehydrogenase (short-subunit alcohol dehydrogenase family)